ncbi:uncharacterized protein LOC115211605 [Argonauta hians]
MPRLHKKILKTFSEDDLRDAINCYKNGGKGVTFRSVARKFGVPRSTLERWVNKRESAHFRSGRDTVLSTEIEEYLIEALLYLGDLGWTLDNDQLKFIVKSYLDSMELQTVFKNNVPGDDWLHHFMNRWEDRLTLRKPNNVNNLKVRELPDAIIEGFFQMLTQLVNQLGITDLPERFYNLNETGLNLDPKKKKTFHHRGIKNGQYVMPSVGKTLYTVLFCGNAEGEYLPPYVIYKGKYLYDTWMMGGPAGTTYNITETGWMDDYVFENWVTQTFLPFVKNREKPIIVFFDGNGSHITYQTASKARNAGVHLVCLPPHSSGALQPLEISVYGPAKKVWHRILQTYYKESSLKSVQKLVFPSLLKRFFDEAFLGRKDNLINGFRKSGFCPLDAEKGKLISSKNLDRSEGDAGPSRFQSKEDAEDAASNSKTKAKKSSRSSSVVAEEKTKTAKKTLKRQKRNVTADGDDEYDHDEDDENNATPSKEQKRIAEKAEYTDESTLIKEAILRFQPKMKRKNKSKSKKKSSVANKSQSGDNNSGNNNDNNITEEIDDSICYICLEEDPETDQEDINWVGCDNCPRWFHVSCVNDCDNPCKVCS